jgi:hypothetical protein
MTRTPLSLGSCQGIFFLGVRVQKDGEIFADLSETPIQQLLRRRANNHPIPIAGRGIGSLTGSLGDEAITYCAAYKVYVEIVC